MKEYTIYWNDLRPLAQRRLRDIIPDDINKPLTIIEIEDKKSGNITPSAMLYQVMRERHRNLLYSKESFELIYDAMEKYKRTY